jgi:hypothetical protein
MRKKIALLLIAGSFCVVLSPVCKAQEQSYFSKLGQTFTRGIKNVVSFPWEIPVTIKKRDAQDDGSPRVFRDTTGFFDGAFRALGRFGCGAWDMVFSIVPGDQEGLPLKPETFF